MANEIIYALGQCTICDEIINTNELSHEKHLRYTHGEETITFKKYLDDILLAAGAGHMEHIKLIISIIYFLLANIRQCNCKKFRIYVEKCLGLCTECRSPSR